MKEVKVFVETAMVWRKTFDVLEICGEEIIGEMKPLYGFENTLSERTEITI
jgi:hypothetical protein